MKVENKAEANSKVSEEPQNINASLSFLDKINKYSKQTSMTKIRKSKQYLLLKGFGHYLL
jgi:hypothetical protein